MECFIIIKNVMLRITTILNPNGNQNKFQAFNKFQCSKHFFIYKSSKFNERNDNACKTCLLLIILHKRRLFSKETLEGLLIVHFPFNLRNNNNIQNLTLIIYGSFQQFLFRVQSHVNSILSMRNDDCFFLLKCIITHKNI